jgi:hypothetical protein
VTAIPLERVIALLTRGKKVDALDLNDAKDLASFLTQMTAADLRRLGTWLYFDGTFDVFAFESALKRLEEENG